MYLSTHFLKGCLLLFLLFWTLPETAAEWRKEQVVQVEKKQQQKKAKAKHYAKPLQITSDGLLIAGFVLAIVALILGFVTGIGFAINGIAAWGMITLICGSYVGFMGGIILISASGSYGLGAAVGAMMGVAGVILAGIFNALPLFITALARGLGGLTLAGGILIGALALITLLALTFV